MPLTDTVYLDFKNAFDTVSHNELLLKLWHFGITWMWFIAYLSEGHQFVFIGNSHSGILPVISGVPKGNILGPLLLLIYIYQINSLSPVFCSLLMMQNVLCQFSLYTADCDSLQSDLFSLADWSSEWKLSFNELKCCVLRFIEVNIMLHLLPTPSIILTSLQFIPKRILV